MFKRAFFSMERVFFDSIWLRKADGVPLLNGGYLLLLNGGYLLKDGYFVAGLELGDIMCLFDFAKFF